MNGSPWQHSLLWFPLKFLPTRAKLKCRAGDESPDSVQLVLSGWSSQLEVAACGLSQPSMCRNLKYPGILLVLSKINVCMGIKTGFARPLVLIKHVTSTK